MSAMQGFDLSLPEAYRQAAGMLEACDGRPLASPSQVDNCSRLLAVCKNLIQRAALFSGNEDKDDLLTAHIKYLLVPYFMAELLNSRTQHDAAPLARSRQLNEALELYSEYLQRCDQYGFLTGACRDTYAAEEQGIMPDPGTCRNQRIERFNRSRALTALVQQMRHRKESADEEAGTEAGSTGITSGWDEEDERHLWTVQVEAAAIKALEVRHVIRQEMQLLQHAVRQHTKQRDDAADPQSMQSHSDIPCRASSSIAKDTQQRVQLQQQVMERLAGIAGQLSLSGDRQTLQQQVFRPSHILPTLTVEQAGEMEMCQARDREAARKQAEAGKAAAHADQRSDDGDDVDLARQRARDDFTDDNPRGWGNSKLRPCA